MRSLLPKGGISWQLALMLLSSFVVGVGLGVLAVKGIENEKGSAIPYGKLLKPEEVIVSVAHDLDDLSYISKESYVRVTAFHDGNENGKNDDESIFNLRIIEDRETEEALLQVAERVQQIVGESSYGWLVIRELDSERNYPKAQLVNDEIYVDEDLIHILRKSKEY